MDTNFNNDQNNDSRKVIENTNNENKEETTNQYVVNQANNINTNNENNIVEPEAKKKSGLFIPILLSVIVGFIGFSVSYQKLFVANPRTGNELDIISNIFGDTFTGIITFINTLVLLLIIWVFHLGVIIKRRIDSKASPKAKKVIKVVAVLLFIFCLFEFTINKIKYDNKHSGVKNYNLMTLKEILNKVPSSTFYDSSSYYFIYKDKIYFYDFGYEDKLTSLDDPDEPTFYDKLYQMDLNGKNKKVISEDGKLRFTKFEFIYNDEAYFHSNSGDYYGKINLKTYKITDLCDKIPTGIYQKYMFNDNYKFFYENDYNNEEPYVLFRKNNINTKETISEVRVKRKVDPSHVIFDYDYGNLYYIGDLPGSYFRIQSIYKNNDEIYRFNETEYNDFGFQILAFLEDYIYIINNRVIYKIDTINNTRQVISEDYTEISRIDNLSGLNYYYENEKIYYLDTENDEFVEMLDNVKTPISNVYKANDLLIFTGEVDRLYDKSGTVIVYNKNTKDKKIYENVHKVNLEDNYMYLVQDKKDNYVVNKIKLY